MRYMSVCSGIEAASVAWGPLGWQAVAFSEIEPFTCAVLAHHYPDVPNLGDMTKLPDLILRGDVEAPDLLCGGTPCQAFSVAGLRRSLDDERGNLSLTFCEIADAIDHVRGMRGQQPSIIFWENVPGVLSTKDNAFGCFIAGLAGEDDPLQPPGGKWKNAGVVLGPKRAVAWRTLDAQYFGLAQRRRRVFVVASAREGFDPAAVLFEFDGVRRDTAPSREAGQAAPTIPSRSTGGGGLGTDFDCDGGLIHADPIARCVTAGEAKRQDWETCNFVAHSLRGEGFDASEGGTGRGTPLVPVGVTINGTAPTVQKVASYDELAQCLRARTPGNIDNSSTTFVQQPVAFAQNSRNEVRLEGGDGQRCGALSTGGGKPGQGVPMIAFHHNAQAAQLPTAERDTSISDSLTCSQQAAVATLFIQDDTTPKVNEERAGCLRRDAGGEGACVMTPAMQVRRLTPRECERLQGFPDDYTAIPWRGKPASDCPDGPRYKALGNSWAVPVVRWIGERINALHGVSGSKD